MEKYNKRSDVPEKYKWDLTDFYMNEQEFDDELKKINTDIDKEKEFVNCTRNADKLYEFLEYDSKIEARVLNLYVYAYLVNDQELGISSSMKRKNESNDIYNKYSNIVSFFKPELLKLSVDEYNSLFDENKLLGKYKSLLDKIYRDKEHVLSENEERIINDLCNSMDHFAEMSSTMLNSEHNYGDVEIDGENINIRQTNLNKLLKNKSKEKRLEIYSKYNKVIDQYSNSSAQFLNSYVKSKIAIARIKGFKDSWDEKLYKLNMPNKAYTTLVDVVENNLDVLQNYFKVYKKTLNLDNLNQYDLSLDLVDSNIEYTIEDAQQLIREALKPLGNDYLKCFEKIIYNRYIDYCEYDGKCSGGYSFSTHDKDSRILLSFNSNLESVSTIIHEAGHNVHHQMISKNNILCYRDVSPLVSEVASLTNECLLSSYLAENGKTAEEKKSGIENILGVIVSNLFGAVREGHVEQEFYNEVANGGSITKEYMDNLTKDYLNKYYGDTVELGEYSGLSWARRSHYYMNYYLYSYAICISVASSVASKILTGDKVTLDNYMKFLKTGNDVWPIDAFKILGVDLEKEDVYIDAINYFKDLLNKFESIN